jgi:anaerobic ribonucleoside-triphosphate reductase activating protein
LEFDEAAKQEIFAELEKDYIHGITFSGGDPLHINNAYDVASLAKEIRKKFPKKSIWLYTGGTWDEVKHMRVIPYLDVLVDGEFEVDKKDVNLHWVGSSNQRVIDVPKTLKEGKVVLHEN